MRAPLQPYDTATTCFASGKVLPTHAWPRCHRRLPIAAQHGFRSPAARPAAAPSPSTRAEAYSGSAPLGGYASSSNSTGSSSSSTASSAASSTTAAAAAAPPAATAQEGPPGPMRNPLMDPYKGGQVVGRPKPLKINLDLALYRARQMRISATRSQDLAERSRLLRESETALRRCLELDPTDGRAYVSLGKILVLQRRYEEAAKLYEAGAAATGGTNAHIWAAWAYLAVKQGNTFLARKLYDAALVADNEHAAAWHGWGLMEKGLGNVSKARDLWIKGIKATTRRPNPYLYQSLAVLAAEMGVTEEARKWFQRGTDTVMGAASHALWQAWALMEKRQGDKHAVRTLLRRGLAVSPRSRYTYLALALWEKEQGDLQEARRVFKEGSRLNPRDAAILQAWALMEQEQGNLQEARRLFKQGSLADPSHLYIWQAWGVLESRAGNLDTARELFQQGVWSAPPRDRDVCLIFQAWAVLEAGAGNPSMARQLFKCAVKADPKSEPSWLAWAEMEDGLGAFDRANELRSFSLQERQEVVRPANFTTMPSALQAQNPLAQISNMIAKWFNLGDDNETFESSDDDTDPLAPFRSVDVPEKAPAPAVAATAAPAAAAVAPAAAARAGEVPSFEAVVAGGAGAPARPGAGLQ